MIYANSSLTKPGKKTSCEYNSSHKNDSEATSNVVQMIVMNKYLI